MTIIAYGFLTHKFTPHISFINKKVGGMEMDLIDYAYPPFLSVKLDTEELKELIAFLNKCLEEDQKDSDV